VNDLLRGPALPLTLALLATGVWWLRSAPSPADDPRTPVAEGVNPTHGDFTLTTADGSLSLSDLRGQAVIVYFGYTACPDICPTTLSTLGSAWRALPEALQPEATALFVSVDPERDRPERIAEYARYFGPSFLAGTADPATIARIAADWGVRYRKVATEGSAMGYAVDHSTQSFLVGPDGALLDTIAHGTPYDEVARRWAEAARTAPTR